MILTYYGGQFVKVQAGDTIVAVNPISKSSKLKTTKFGADVALTSINIDECNGIDEVTFGDKVPFVVQGPGEYEVSDIFIKGFASKFSSDKKEKINTIYSVLFDNINLCFLGLLKSEEISEEAIESLTDIDILFVPLGENTISPSKAYKLAVSLVPKMIIPLGEEEYIKQFLKEAGSGPKERLDKLTLKRKDLEGKEGDIVLLNA